MMRKSRAHRGLSRSSRQMLSLPNRRIRLRDRRAAEQGDEADEAFGGTVARQEVPPHARAGQLLDAGTASQLIWKDPLSSPLARL